jgi:enoyl-CoA hydratase
VCNGPRRFFLLLLPSARLISFAKIDRNPQKGSTVTALVELDFEMQGAMALVTLNRPKALNALTEAMRQSFDGILVRAARDPQTYCVVVQSASTKAFSAGSDVREVVTTAKADVLAGRRLFANEYALNWRCECFSKPMISLINGMVMGGGVGISLYGTHRVAAEDYSFAMPETMIGLFPDVGACHVLARLPNEIGMYLGLTGRSIKRADAYHLGLVTHTIPAVRFEEIKRLLTDAHCIDPVLDDCHEDPGRGGLDQYAETIARCFSAPSVEEIIGRLDITTGSEQDWAAAVAADLRSRAPLSLKVTHRHIQESRARDLRATLEVDYLLGVHFLDGHDFHEGARALLIEKDGAPKWKPSRLVDVSNEMVEAYFQPINAFTLNLPSRTEMQAARA